MKMVLWVHIRLFSGYLALIMTGMYVKAWTYHYNKATNLEWTQARQWCQKHYTDLVAIQNQAEVVHLNQILPYHKQYYWIGIRKLDGHWTWVGTKKRLAPEAANWAPNEPNNKGIGEDCVEIYIKRINDTAMWNNEKCIKKKAALCYLASCSNKSCSEHAECLETIGNYTCQCNPGFTGPRCEEVVECLPIGNPELGSLRCDGVFGEFHFNSSCQFQCATGYKLEGAQRLHCLASGLWNNALPVCQVVQCLPITDNSGVWRVNCTHPLSMNSYNSSCEFKCEEGFVLEGSTTVRCDQNGHWTDKTPTCKVVTCDPLLAPTMGHLTCADPLGKFSFHSSCNVSCKEGYRLRGKIQLTCLRDGTWSAPTPSCEAVACNPLTTPGKGHLTCADPLGKFSFRSSCNATCEEGYRLRGETTLSCQSDATWSAPTPTCEAVHCEPLSLSHLSPELGLPPSMNCSHPGGNFGFGSQCVFQCAEGHVLIGTSELDCTSRGYWTDSPPSCVEEMSVSAGMLMYAAVGAASSAGLLLLGGLIILLVHKFTKKRLEDEPDSDQRFPKLL
ncbi:P-selectin isoform X2 [Xyrauchen texanus]|uniref:P-selectin isoform X2 n=1 Tax=Xyrauchen texanus TaxID=154827 RepID=UPI0022426EEA|nr:P-selectin isoform X2 [Xyrauchen texanus]